MASFMREFEHLRIRLEEIKEATNNFGDKAIGSGGFGAVYAGEVSHHKERSIVAIKRLNSRFGQGQTEFSKEIMMLSWYRHQNLISLLGFCDEEDEKVLVYEYAPKGSLDRHLSDPGLTWTQRIKICLGAAKGLSYLHDPRGTHQRVLHCDIKSANILLDENMTAKVADFGLSKMGPANQKHSVVVTNASGTPGYTAPEYVKESTLTKESDVYSFGIVLFEVLCGRLCCQYYSNGQVQTFVPMWKQRFSENKLHEIIFPHLMPQMDRTSLKSFSDVAFQCLLDSLEGRPSMSKVVEELERALEIQERYDLKLPEGYMEVYKEIIMAAVPPLNYTSEEELKELLFKGTFCNGGKTWFSINKKGEHCELISISECLTRNASEPKYVPEHKLRFAAGSYKPDVEEFRTHVKTEFLSPQITYTVNLVLKNTARKNERYIGLSYKLEGGKKSYAYLSDKIEDGWLSVELFQFTSNNRNVDLKIIFYIKHCQNILVEGIEFRPLEKVEEHEVVKNEREDFQPISDSDSDLETFWEKKLPKDYEDIVKCSKHGVQYASKQELYSILRKGFLINNGKEENLSLINNGEKENLWFSLAKDGKKCLMLSPRAALEHANWKWKSLPETRFEVAHDPSEPFDILCVIESGVLSPLTTYASYLVYKQEGRKVQPPPARVKNKSYRPRDIWYIYLSSPQTPVIITETVSHTHGPMNRPKIKGLPQQRSDGWMEVQIWESRITNQKIGMHLKLSCYDKTFEGIEVQGIEFRPK